METHGCVRVGDTQGRMPPAQRRRGGEMAKRIMEGCDRDKNSHSRMTRGPDI